MLFQSLDSGLRRNDDLIRTSLMSSTDFASRAPKGSPNTKGNGSTDLRCVVFLGSPYGANPSTAGLWESTPKGRGGVFADTLNVCPRRRAPRHGWRGRGIPKAEELRQGRQERRVRSARAPKPEERRVGLRHPGRPFFWLLFFMRAKKS